MGYDLKLAERIRAELQGLPLIEKKMFGGVGYILNGNTLAPGASAGVACGVLGEELLVRVHLDDYARFLSAPHVKPFAMTGKPTKGWLTVEPDGCKTAKQLGKWVRIGVEFASTLPPK